MVAFFERLAPTVIAIDACGASHHWARLLQSFGHEVKLIAPQLVKPYVKRGKNDAADTEALCEAMSRPSMRRANITGLGARQSRVEGLALSKSVEKRQSQHQQNWHPGEVGCRRKGGCDMTTEQILSNQKTMLAH
jgi:transposase